MNGLLKIEFPQQQPSVREGEDSHEIFDPIRKIWIILTPEEWVRQNFILFLLDMQYPAALMAVEKKILVNSLTKRCDIVVYARDATPFLIVECKQMEVNLSQKVLDQILRYHITLQAPYLIITNGTYTMGFKKENSQFVPIIQFPKYGQMS